MPSSSVVGTHDKCLCKYQAVVESSRVGKAVSIEGYYTKQDRERETGSGSGYLLFADFITGSE